MPALAGSALAQTQFLIIEGRLDAIVKGIDSDYREAFQASTPALQSSLAETRMRLRKSVEDFRSASRALAGLSDGAAGVGDFERINQAAMLSLRDAWAAAQHQLNGLVDARISAFYTRMWLHLGTALLLIAVLSLVFFVARQIALPIRNLARVAENVRRSGDYKLRARGAHHLHADRPDKTDGNAS